MSSLVSLKEEREYFIDLALEYIRRQENALAKVILDKKNVRDATIDAMGTTLLHFAADEGNVEITSYLLGLGMNVDVQDQFGYTPLIKVLHDDPTRDVKLKDISIIHLLLRAGSNYFLKNQLGFNALQLAYILRIINTGKRNVDVMKLFLELTQTNCKNDSELMTKILMDSGCSLERTMLLNNVDLTRAMIARGCPVDQRHSEGTTALHAAVNLMSLEHVKALIELGADVYAEDAQGLTPLQYYCKMNYYNTAVKDSEDAEIVRIMMKNIDDVNRRARGWFIIETVACRGNEEAVKILLQYDLDFHAKDESKNTLLHYFGINLYTNVVPLMKEIKLDLNLRGTDGSIMLAAALTNANAKVVRMLLESGVHPNSVANLFPAPSLLTAIGTYIAKKASSKSTECIALLLEHGAGVLWHHHTYTSVFTTFSLIRNSDNIAKLVIQHVAIDDVCGKPIPHEIRTQVTFNPSFENHFQKCKKYLQEMNKIIVYGPISMFTLLAENEEAIARRFAYNEDILKILIFISKQYGPFLYYDRIVHERSVRMVQKIELILSAAKIICSLIGQKGNVYSVITHTIIGYLDFVDLERLDKLEINFNLN